jgi:acetyltransferase-like isoleucine patch superfamily enzyme
MNQLIKSIIRLTIPYYKQYLNVVETQIPFSYTDYILFKINMKKLYWYKHKNCTVSNSSNIFVGINCLIGRPGCYIQGAGKVYIGDYVQFGPNVGVLSANHDLYDQNKYNIAPIRIGDYSWIGMNSVVTAGVELGIRTIVGAGSVVTKSFLEGYCVIAGNPAKVIKYLDKDKFVPWHYEKEYYGLIPKEKFDKYRKNYIDI